MSQRKRYEKLVDDWKEDVFRKTGDWLYSPDVRGKAGPLGALHRQLLPPLMNAESLEQLEKGEGVLFFGGETKCTNEEIDILGAGVIMESLNELFKDVNAELTEAKTVLQKLAQEVTKSADAVGSAMLKHLVTLRSTRAEFAVEVSKSLAEIQGVRAFFMGADSEKEIARLNEFVKVGEKLKQLKDNGTLDLLATTMRGRSYTKKTIGDLPDPWVCTYCGEPFPSSQSGKAHLRWCPVRNGPFAEGEWPTINRLANAKGISTRTAQRWLASGWVERRQLPDGRFVYAVAKPGSR